VADVISETESVPQVLTEIQGGEGLSLSAAGRLFPGHRGSKSVDPSTVLRWLTKGARTTGGHLVKLEAVRVGARWITSRGAVARFVAVLTTAAIPPATKAVAPTRTTRQREQAAERAIRDLERRGA
jgi:hypothetical protein